MEPEENRPVEHIVLPAKKKSLLWLWILLAVVVLGGAVGAYAGRGYLKKLIYGEEKKAEEAKTDDTEKTTTPTTPTSIKIVDEGVAWITPPEKLADLKLVTGTKDENSFGYDGTTYYKVATTTEGWEIILAKVKMTEMGDFYCFHRFLKKSGQYYHLTKNSEEAVGYTIQNAEADSTYTLKSLLADEKIIKGSTELNQSLADSKGATFSDAAITGTKVEETKWGDLYLSKDKDVDKSNGDVKVSRYFIVLNDGVKLIYIPKPAFMKDDSTLTVTWSLTAGSGSKYYPVKTGGCAGGGGTFPLVTDTDSLKVKVKAATSSTGSIVYTVTDQTATITEFAYQMYLLDQMSSKVTKDVFLANVGFLLWQDDYKNWTILLNEKYMPMVECGKPVIYLYPEKDTNVSVQVGADITKSEPEYKNGWSVLAKKGGQMFVDGKAVPYLFWEGLGKGVYPEIKSGLVVEKSKVAATLTAQMKSMGLNDKEITDFNEFWLPRIPDMPFVRLTWLTTSEMDKLAPLKVVPRPQSSIRVFLDFEGLKNKISIAPQILPKYQRNGFTLVEWGGLLKGSR